MKLHHMLLLGGLLGLVTAAAEPGPSSRPNILFLLSDDHSYPYLGCYGDPNVRTPTLDQLAAGGMKFHSFFTTAPQCVPSRASLMTGRSPVAARITRFSSPLPRDVVTFPEVLREKAGYFVGVCGRSYHLDGAKSGDLLEKHGLRTFEKRFDSVRTGSDTETARQTEEFLDLKPAGKPFFLWVNFSDPHHPWNAPAADRPDPATLRIPAHLPDLPGVRDQLADYCAEVNRLDQSVRKVLDVLTKRGLAENTIIVFCGDNGQALPHGKGSLYDSGCRVPFVVNWPGVVAPGGESHALLSGEDLAPTLLAAAGLEVPAGMTGVGFLPLLRGGKPEPREFVFFERGPHGSAPVTLNMTSSGYDLSRAVRSERYKFIYNCTPWIPYSPVDSAGGAAWSQMKAARETGKLTAAMQAGYFTAPRPVYELYDLKEDPAELQNLSGKAELAAIETKLRTALAEKMIVDFDYLPLPEITAAGARGKASGNNRQAAFLKLDTDGDGRLSPAEFATGRAAEDAERWFKLRDADQDGFVSRGEYLRNLEKQAVPARE